MASKPEILQLVRYLSAAYPGAHLSDETDAVYFKMLGHLSMDTLQRAADMCLQECKYFPTIADIHTMLSRMAQSIRNTSLATPNKFTPPPPGVREKMDKLFKKWNVCSAKRERELASEWPTDACR